MASRGFDVYLVSADNDSLGEVAEKEGVDYFHVEMTRAITPISDIISIWNLFRFLKKENVQIIHSHTPKAGLVGMVAGWMAGVPVRLHTIAGLPLMEKTGLLKRILIIVEKITYSFAHKVYPNSKGLYDFIKKNISNSTKVSIIGGGTSNGIDTKFFSKDQLMDLTAEEVRQQYGIAKDDFVFCFIGRMVGDKGINELVTAFQSMPINCKLLLVGPLEAELDPLQPETLRIMRADTRIVSTGYQTDVRPFLSISDVFVFPSYREGFPNVPLQAGCFDLPCIVSDIVGCNEVIIDKVNGLIVPPKNVDQLAKAMTTLYENTELRNYLASNARRLVEERYSQVKLWELIFEEYRNQLISKGFNVSTLN